MSEQFKNLFSPIKINTMELKNRVVMPAMGTGYGSTDSKVTDKLIAYLEKRAIGGTGLIITEVCAIDQRAKGFPSEIGIWNDEFIPGLKKLNDKIHAAGSKIAVQLHHAGRETFEGVTGFIPEAPSAIPSPILNQPCEEMSTERVYQIIELFGDGAARAKKAGFDAVEIHGAHGYLGTQFLSSFSNHREDEFGGSDEKRAKFLIECVKNSRQKVGSDFPIIVRISATEAIRDGYDIEFAKWLSPKLEEAGADALHVSIGVYSTPGNLSIAGMDTEEGFNLFRAKTIKETVRIPVIGVGRIHDPYIAEEALENNDADLISFGRQHLADENFLKKTREGRPEDIRKCLACNQGCIDRLMFEMKPATCSINPMCGNELNFPTKSEKPVKVMIIGAGPAGLSAAMAASDRGHDVTVYEKDSIPGGQMNSASTPPNKHGFSDWVQWARRQLKKMNIPLILNTAVDESILLKEKPDSVILTTGAMPSVPYIEGLDESDYIDARDILLGKIQSENEAVILGAGYVGMETADYLAERNIKVTIFEKNPFPPVNTFTAHGYWLYRRLKKAGVEIILNADISSIKDKTIYYRTKDITLQKGPFPSIITALGALPENKLEKSLKKLEIPYITAGDINMPRRLLEAVHEGFAAGNSI